MGSTSAEMVCPNHPSPAALEEEGKGKGAREGGGVTSWGRPHVVILWPVLAACLEELQLELQLRLHGVAPTAPMPARR